MGKKYKPAISPTREEDYSKWYQEVIKASDLAEHSSVRGCMVIKPWGYSIWENIMDILNKMFKATGIKNAYFPLFIPLSFMEKEAEHVDGFAKECAVVTHHKLEQGKNKRLVPAGPLTEPLIIRPTSETIIGESFSKWIKSYRDLPVLINQWANVVRWEMRTRIFLRTSEFLWQEGHTAHETKKEAEERTRQMLDIYKKFAEEYLAIPVSSGAKSSSEKFPGAIDTLCIEAMMQDKKALQSGTSHFLGQNFAKSSNIRFTTKKESEELAWTTSWGVSTRLIGGLIMTHGDDNGIILPPKIAPAHVVLLPIIRKSMDAEKIMKYTNNLAAQLREKLYNNSSVIVEIDKRDIGGAKGWDWIKKGIPLRVEIGQRDMDQNSVFVGRRDMLPNEKKSINKDEFVEKVSHILDEIQNSIFSKANKFKNENTISIDQTNMFYDFFTPKSHEKPEIHGGFVLSHWCGSRSCEKKIKEDLSVTIRCIPFESEYEKGSCIHCNAESKQRVIFAKSY